MWPVIFCVSAKNYRPRSSAFAPLLCVLRDLCEKYLFFLREVNFSFAAREMIICFAAAETVNGLAGFGLAQFLARQFFNIF